MKKTFLLTFFTIVVFFSYSQDTLRNDGGRSVTGRVVEWYNSHLNYGTVTLLMMVESSFVPFPSEVIVPPAAYQACNEDNASLYVTDSKFLNVLIVVFFATVGAIAGALVNYFLAMIVGRPIVYWFADSRVGRMLLLDSQKVKKAEAYFNEHGNVSTLVGRLIPAIRQLISIPAGLAKMNLGMFVLFTSIGAACWNSVLAVLGYVAHGQKDLIDKYNHELTIVLLALCALGVLYVAYKWFKSARKPKKTAE